ncbi:alpha/beta hydrolase family protein [Kineococcus terrestris]|uniref:alpha/beta hydrolase family protein n=1 Tax=Kineococcus terrestris TaxID=2044856 RepID=UPI0034DB34D4
MSGTPVVPAVAAPGALGDERTAREVLARAAAARGVGARLVATASDAAFRDAAAAAARDGELLLLPPPAVDVDALGLALGDARVVRVDVVERGPDRSGAVRRHVRGRGLAGLRWAVDAWWAQRAHPSVRHAYGPHPDQHADLRLPAGTGPVPVAVLVHGGYWRSRWEADTLEPLAVDLAARGWASWNAEYRRPDADGWDATTADVAAAVRALADVPGPAGARLDPGRVVLLGHSAGGQLVVRLAADLAGGEGAVVRPALVVSLAGCLDLVTVDRRWLSEGAASRALGGRAEEVPDVYAASSPLARLPIGLPVAVVRARQDDPDLLDVSRSFAAAARAAGDDVLEVEGEGDHFAPVDPASPLWAEVADLVATRVRP